MCAHTVHMLADTVHMCAHNAHMCAHTVHTYAHNGHMCAHTVHMCAHNVHMCAHIVHILRHVKMLQYVHTYISNTAILKKLPYIEENVKISLFDVNGFQTNIISNHDLFSI